MAMRRTARRSSAVMFGVVASIAGTAAGQANFLSTTRSISTGARNVYVDTLSSNTTGSFNQTLDQVYQIEESPGLFRPVHALATLNSSVAPSQISLSGIAAGEGSVFIGGGNWRGANSRLSLDLTFSLVVPRAFHLFGSNSAESIIGQSLHVSQYIRLTRDGGVVVFDRTYIPTHFEGPNIIPEAGEGAFDVTGVLPSGLYRLEILSELDSGYSSPSAQNRAEVDFTLQIPGPGSLWLGVLGLAAAARRRR